MKSGLGPTVAVFVALLMLGCCAVAQSTSPPLPDAPSAQEQHRDSDNAGAKVFGVPQYNVVSAKDAKPLSPKEKWHLFVREATDPFSFAGAAVTSGFAQATDEYHGYGQGAAGYAKRFAAAAADSVDSTLWGGFILPVLFKEDPRYFRLGQGSMKHRVGYAISRVGVTQTDSGHRSFNFSSVLGNLIAGGISNVYYPEADRGVGLTLRRTAVVTGLGALGRIGLEFLPDLDRKIMHRKSKTSSSASSTQPSPQK